MRARRIAPWLLLVLIADVLGVVATLDVLSSRELEAAWVSYAYVLGVVMLVRPLLFAPFAAIAVVFPDGRLPSARWRRVAIAAAASFAFLQVLLFLAPRELDEPFDVVSSPLPQLAYLRAADAG